MRGSYLSVIHHCKSAIFQTPATGRFVYLNGLLIYWSMHGINHDTKNQTMSSLQYITNVHSHFITRTQAISHTHCVTSTLHFTFPNRWIQIRSGATSGSDVGSFFFKDPISSSRSREDVHPTPDVGRPTSDIGWTSSRLWEELIGCRIVFLPRSNNPANWEASANAFGMHNCHVR